MSRRHSQAKSNKEVQVRDLLGGIHKIPGDYPIPVTALVEFLDQIDGQVVLPGDSDYDSARAGFNPTFPAYPKLIVFCLCLADIRACLTLARTYGLQVVPRSGRHSLAGYSVNDGLVIDLSQLNSVYIDVENETAIIGAGTQFERLNANLESYGLHVPGGGCPTVCAAGFMQGGGYGFTSREFGIHSDNVLAFKMLLANGKVVTANENQNPDLFWGVRGGTGNQFGILLEISYKLHRLGKVWGIRLDWCVDTHKDEAALALETIQNAYIRSTEHNKLGFQTTIGYDTNVKEGIKVMFLAVYTGEADQLDAVLLPLLAIPGCQVVKRVHDRYSMVDQILLTGMPNIPGLWVKAMSRSCYISRDLSRNDWHSILGFLNSAPNFWTMVDMEAYGGTISNYPVEKSAFIHRDVTVDFFCDVFWDKEEDRETNAKWLLELMTFMKQYSNGHSYQNYPNRDQTDWRWAYFGKYYPTLQWVKRKYDPDNFFRFQQSITLEPDVSHNHEYAPVLFSDPTVVYEKF